MPIANQATPSADDAQTWNDTTCRRTLHEAEIAFRHGAPTVYPAYASLGWEIVDEGEPDEPLEIPPLEVHVTPGRSWSFKASLVDYVDSDEPAVTADVWKKFPDYDALYARRVGDHVLRISVETERSAMRVDRHPLVIDFVKRMKTALDACAATL
jgi:hypothetical protein